MRRRWEWPILRRLAKIEPFNWLSILYVWLMGGLFVLFVPAAIVDSDAHDNVYLGTYLLVALIVWLTPIAMGALIAIGLGIRSVIAKYGPDLLPRRVTESVEDIRERYREKDIR